MDTGEAPLTHLRFINAFMQMHASKIQIQFLNYIEEGMRVNALKDILETYAINVSILNQQVSNIKEKVFTDVPLALIMSRTPSSLLEWLYSHS